jgi:TP901 family phage tail tape measure protein
MANSTLGVIRGRIIVDYDGAGVARANRDLDGLKRSGVGAQGALSTVSTAALGMGVAVAAGFAVAVNSASNFEKGLSNIKAVTGATTQEMEKLRQKALQLGKDTKFSAGEAAAAMEELAKAGISTTDILNGAADATVALAAAGDVALPEAATIAANAMNQFALSARDLPRVADLIAGAANASAIDVHQFGFSLSQVGAVSHLAGINFRDTAVAIALLGNAGIVGSDAGTSLKTTLQNLIPQTKAQRELARELGIITQDGANRFFDATGKARSLAEISQVLQDATKNLSKEQKLAALSTLFGSDAIRASAILSEQGAAGFNNMATAMDKVKAADVAATKMDNFKGSLEEFKGSLETMAITVGSLLLPHLRTIIETFTRWVNAFSNLSPQTQKTVVTIVAIAGALALFIGIVGKIIVFINAFRVAWIGLNLSFVATPIGAIITAIVLLIGLIIYLAVKTTFFQTVWKYIWGFLKAVGAWFAGPFADFFVALWNRIVTIFTAIKNFFVSIWNFIVGVFTFFFNIIKGVVGFFAPLFQAVFGLIVSVVRLAFSIIGAIIAIGVAIWKATVVPALQFIWSIIKFVLDAIVGAWNWAWNLVMSVIQAVWGFIGPYVIGAVRAIQAFITPIINAVVNFLVGAWNFVKNTTATVWNGITSFFSTIWNFLVNLFTGAVNRIVAIINGIKTMVDRVRQFFDGLKNAAQGGVGSLISFVSQIPRRILESLGNLGSTLINKGRDLIQGFINGISGMAGRLRNAIINLLPGPLRSFADSLGLSSPSRLFRQWGVFTVQGFINGVSAMQSRLDAAMNAVAGSIAGPGALGGIGTVGASAGRSGPPTAPPPPTVNVAPRVVVVADLGNGVRQVVKSTIEEEPELVSSSSAKGDEYRGFLSPGRNK